MNDSSAAMSLPLLGAPEARLLDMANAVGQIAGNPPSRPVPDLPQAAGPVEVVELSAAAILRHLAAALSDAVAQVTATLEMMSERASAPLAADAVDLQQGEAPAGDRQIPAFTPDAELTRLQPLTTAVGKAAEVLGSAAAAAAPAKHLAPAPLLAARADNASSLTAPETSSQAGVASNAAAIADGVRRPPTQAKPIQKAAWSGSDGRRLTAVRSRHLTQSSRAASAALLGATEILTVVRERMEAVDYNAVRKGADGIDFESTVKQAQIQVALASTQLAGLIRPITPSPKSGPDGSREEGASDANEHVLLGAGSAHTAMPFFLLMMMFGAGSIAMAFLTMLDRPFVRMACAVVLLVVTATFMTRRLRSWHRINMAIRIEHLTRPDRKRS